jgi:pimeloyl-ACP methyl ester carboxylesterase
VSGWKSPRSGRDRPKPPVIGDLVGRLAADDLQTVVIPGVGHWVAELAPEEVLTALSVFLAPYREGKDAT